MRLTVVPVAVNVAALLFVHPPFTFNVGAPDKVKGALALIVTLPFTVRVAAIVQVLVPVLVIVRLL